MWTFFLVFIVNEIIEFIAIKRRQILNLYIRLLIIFVNISLIFLIIFGYIDRLGVVLKFLFTTLIIIDIFLVLNKKLLMKIHQVYQGEKDNDKHS